MKFIKLQHKSPSTGAASGKVYWVRIDSIITVSNNNRISLSNGESFSFVDDLGVALACIEEQGDIPAVQSRDLQEKKKQALAASSALKSTITRIVKYYRETHPTRGRTLKPGSRDWNRIRSRLEEGLTEEELIKAIDGNKICAWHKSHPAGHSVEYVFRNATKIEGFIQLATEGPVKEESIGHHKGSKEFVDGDRRDVF